MNHEVKKKLTNGRHRVNHAHTTNTCRTFVLPLDSSIYKEKKESGVSGCIFQGVVGWMVPGRDLQLRQQTDEKNMM